jgi:predicted MPP superfamily phosphohydrolase
MQGPRYIFLIVVVLVLAALAWLALHLLKKIFPAYRGRRVAAVYWSATLAALFLVGATARWGQPTTLLADLLRVAVFWLVGQVILLIFVPVLYGTARITGLDKPCPEGTGMTRRSFLRNVLAATPAGAFAVSAGGVYGAGADSVLKRYEVRLPQLPSELDGFKIAQISDSHVGLFFSPEDLEKALQKALRAQPDLLVVTGDLVDDLGKLDAVMEKLTAACSLVPHGIYFCWGNHEYFRDINKIRQALHNSPVTLLENDSRLIAVAEKPLYLAAVDYPWAKNAAQQIEVRGSLFGRTMGTVPPGAFTILLSHHPDFIVNAFEAGIPLTLTGHTHGGQVVLFGHSLLPLQYRFMRGMYRQEDTYAYVHSGTGHWMPFRLNCPTEVVLFTLRHK